MTFKKLKYFYFSLPNACQYIEQYTLPYFKDVIMKLHIKMCPT